MVITYFGEQFFKITFGEMVLAINPASKGTDSNAPGRFGADVVMISANLPPFNAAGQFRHGAREPFVIDGPGDYEVKGISVRGVMSEGRAGDRNFVNTIYLFSLDGASIAFFGAYSGAPITKEARENIDSPDIIFMPVAESASSREKIVFPSPAAAAETALSFEPKIIIPMSYDGSALRAFLKASGAEQMQASEKLTLKRKDLEGKEGEVVVLKPAN